jgi:general stress protein 26
MPESTQGMSSKADPSVEAQWDTKTSREDQIKELYAITDKLNSCLLTTQRPNVGLVSRSMSVAKRSGPDFLFIANINSQKFKDIEHSKQVQITFQDSSTENWVSVSGTAVTASNSDPRIKELYNKSLRAWFGDLGDGKHDGGPEDPRMALIEVKSNYVAYWKATVGTLGFIKEVGVAAMTGQVANTGVNRQLLESDLQMARGNAELK